MTVHRCHWYETETHPQNSIRHYPAIVIDHHGAAVRLCATLLKGNSLEVGVACGSQSTEVQGQTKKAMHNEAVV